MKRVFAIALLLVVMVGTASANEAIWKEGEDSNAQTNFNHGWLEAGSTGLLVDNTLLSPGTPGGTAGKWVAEYANSNVSGIYWQIPVNVTEGLGTYTWWARIAPINTMYTYQIDGGTATPVDLGHQHEVINLVRPSIDDVHYIGWVRIATGLTLSKGTHTLRLNVLYDAAHGTTMGGVDAICLLNYQWSPTGAIQPNGSINPDPTPGPSVWYPLHVAEDAFSSNSIIDLKSTVDAMTGVPAGKYGYVTRVQDHFELSGKPGVPVKFWGCDSAEPASTTTYNQQGRFYVKNGINIVRTMPLLTSLGSSSPTPEETVSPAKLDLLDQWFAALKANGVYMEWGFFYTDISTGFSKEPTPDANFQAILTGAGVTMDQLWAELPSDGNGGKHFQDMEGFVTPYEQEETTWATNLLQHVNPYTGLAYYADPALAMLEVQNENSLFFYAPLSTLTTSPYTYPNHTKVLRYMWFQWLQAKYASDAALKTAWGSGWQTGDSVVTFNPNMAMYPAWNLQAAGPFSAANQKARAGDFIEFLAQTQQGHYQRRFNAIRALGFQGVQVTTGWQVGGTATAAANQWTNDAGDAIDRHAYMGGGAGNYYVSTGTVINDVQLSNPGGLIISASVYGTGSGGAAPNESVYQIEDKPAIDTEWADTMPTEWRAEICPLYAFYGMGLQGWDASFHFAGSYAWMETGWPGQGFGPGSWVTETPVNLAQFPALALATYRGDIAQGDLIARRMSVNDLFLGIDPLSQPLPDGSWSGSPNLLTPPEVNAIGRVTMKADPSFTGASSTKFDWTPYWDQTNKILTSSAGGGTLHQLVWDYNNKIVQVKSPMTQALIGWSGGHGAYNLGDVTVTMTTPFASLIFTSLDGKPLSSSASILVTALAQDTEAGAVYAGGGTSLTSVGGPPLYLQPVQANITMGGLPISGVNVVDVYGVPTNGTVPVTSNSFTIDGTSATYYYQITRNTAAAPNIALSTNSLTPSCVQGSSPVNDTFQVWNTGNATLNYSVSGNQPTWLSINPPSGTSSNPTDTKTETVTYSTTGLLAGNYSATITVSDPNATDNPQTISVSLNVETPSAIESDTTVLYPVVTVGGTAISQQFQVWDGGQEPLNYIVSKDQSWLSPNPANGTSTGVADKKTHTISYTTSTLAIGKYDATITITAPAASNNPQTIAVHLTVQAPPPLIARSPTLLSPSVAHGANAANQTFTVWNSVTGGTPLSYTVSYDVAWISNISPGTNTSNDPTDVKTHTITYSTAGLGIGTYNGTITIASAGVVNTPQTIAVQLTINPAPPAIALSTTTLTPFCAQTTNALPQTFQVWNSADQTLNYTVSKDQAWLSVSPTSGASTGPTNQQTHTVTYSTASLTQAGSPYHATITITGGSPAASNSPQYIYVTLSVLSAPPDISASAASFTPTALKGQNAASQSLDIWNSGQGTLAYTAIVSTTDGPPGWAGVSPGTGSSTGVGNTQTHSVEFSTAAMDLGTYHAQIVITSAGASNTPLTIPITLTITAPGTIGTDTASLNPTAVVGVAPADQTMHVWNAGTGTMAYTISADQTWVTINPTSGSSAGVGDPQPHTVSYSPNLGAGLHTANITITGAGISNAPLTIPVNFNVTAPPAIQITSPTAGQTITSLFTTVTGVTGVPGTYQAIWVNGVLATNTGAGFSTWQAPVPLNQVGAAFQEPNTITVSTLDNAGVYNATAASVVVNGQGDLGLIHNTGMAMTVNGAVVPGDVDTYQFQAAAGSTVTLTAKGVGKPAPSLTLVLYNNYDQQMLSRTGSSISLTSVLPGNGLYTVTLISAGGDGGQYTLTLAGTAPNLKWTQNGSIPTQMSVFDHTMSMPNGTLLTASVSSTKFQPTLQVLDPLGNAIPLGGFITTTTGKVTVKSLPIPGGAQNYFPGNYVLRVGSGDGRVGAFTLTCASLAPTPVPDLVNYPLILGTSASKTAVVAGAQLQLSVSGTGPVILGWIDYGGAQPAFTGIVNTSLANGKGTVSITVPAWMSTLPAGTYKVYFWDPVAEEYTNKASFLFKP